MKIQRAVISVSDKTGLAELAPFLKSCGVEIISTGGTKRFLDELGVNPKEVSEHTKKEHREAMEALGIKNIDMIVVNLYPFREVVAKGCTFEEAIENIDIGGPSMIRAAAKNYRYVTVVVDPADYPKIIEEMKAHDGGTTEELRFSLAKKVFSLTSDYDRAIYDYLSRSKG
ncbi:MAG: IMP cyclohydrolase [Syntrophorhabdales bacterium]